MNSTGKNSQDKIIETAWNKWNQGEGSFSKVRGLEYEKLHNEGVPAKYWRDILDAKIIKRQSPGVSNLAAGSLFSNAD